MLFFFFFKQKTAYEVRISDWSSDVCSSDLLTIFRRCGERVSIYDESVSRLTRAMPARRAAVTSFRAARGFCVTAVRCDGLTCPEIGRASCRERVCQYV